MPISHERKFVFVHLVKTAGDSIEKALGLQKDNELYGFEDANGEYYKNIGGMLLSSIRGIDGGMKCLQHLTAVQIKDRYPADVWNSYLKFAFVRNPWDLVVSQYSYVIQSRKDLYEIWGVNKDTTFKDFVVNAKVGLYPQFMFLCPQARFLTDEDGEVIVDFVGRFENLNEDFAKVCEKVGVEAELIKGNSSKHRHYRDYYDEETKGRVADIYADDIKMFGYEF